MNGIVVKVVGWVLPVILGPIVYAGARKLLNVSQKIDDLPPSAKRVVIVALATGVVAAFNALGVTAPAECGVLLQNATDVVAAGATSCIAALSAKVPVQGVTAAVVAMIIHEVKKSSPRS